MTRRSDGCSKTLLLGRQHQLQLRQSQSSKLSGKAKRERLEVSRWFSGVYADGSWQMIGCKYVIYWGDELRFEPLGFHEVDSENNTKNKDYFRAQIQLKRDKSVILSKRSKQFNQQYNQDKPEYNNGYIISNIYVKAKNLSRGPILRGCRKINSRAIPNIIC